MPRSHRHCSPVGPVRHLQRSPDVAECGAPGDLLVDIAQNPRGRCIEKKPRAIAIGCHEKPPSAHLPSGTPGPVFKHEAGAPPVRKEQEMSAVGLFDVIYKALHEKIGVAHKRQWFLAKGPQIS
ncbi:unnamed protein product [Lota lota]